MEEKYLIDKSLVDALMAYLMSKPMSEVEGGVQGLRQLVRYEQPENKELKLVKE